MAFRAINRFSSCFCSYRRPWQSLISGGRSKIVAFILPSTRSFSIQSPTRPRRRRSRPFFRWMVRALTEKAIADRHCLSIQTVKKRPGTTTTSRIRVPGLCFLGPPGGADLQGPTNFNLKNALRRLPASPGNGGNPASSGGIAIRTREIGRHKRSPCRHTIRGRWQR
jgi:hypothetical protein